MSKSFYITTPIFYPNDRLHLGHAYTMVMADIIARYKKSKGYLVYFQTGSDDHGEKIAKKAVSLNLTPKELVDKNVLFFQQLWQKLGISEHSFYRTHTPLHQEKVQKIFTKLLEQDDIYLGKYQGDYCIICEDYISQGKSEDGYCPFCHSQLKKIAESAYFLRVSKYYSWLLDYYQQNPYFLLPLSIKKELTENFLKNDIRDLCITRRDVKWGIPVPHDKELVIYVWFEALCNYINLARGKQFFFAEFTNEKEISSVKEVACVAIKNKNKEYLLVYNKKYNHWQFPGGKLEQGENTEEAAKREIFEETNLIIEELEKIGEENFYVDDIWWKIHFYQTEKYSGELLIKEKETVGEIKFLEISKIQEINSQSHDEVTEYLLEKLTNKDSSSDEIVQVVGKDIARFHGIYWPIILMLLEVRLPSQILAHGWILDKFGEKGSKSKGNVVDPLKLLEKYPNDLLRCYFVAKINFLQDGIFEEKLFQQFYQDFLVNNLSNLVSRVKRMLILYNEGIIPANEKLTQENIKIVKKEKLENYYHKCESTVKDFQKKMDKYELTNAFWEIENLLNESNKLIAELTPWELAKKGEKLLLNWTLNYLSNGIKIVAFLLNCIIPETSEKIWKTFNIDNEKLNWDNLLDFNFLNSIKIKTLGKHLYEPLK